MFRIPAATSLKALTPSTPLSRDHIDVLRDLTPRPPVLSSNMASPSDEGVIPEGSDGAGHGRIPSPPGALPGSQYGPITPKNEEPCPSETATSSVSLAGSIPATPTRESALPFYSGLFGWEFEDAMPQGPDGEYYVGRIRGGDAAAIGSIPPGAPPLRCLEHVHMGRQRRRDSSQSRDAGGSVLTEPFDVLDMGRMAVLADPEGAAFCVWEARAHQGARWSTSMVRSISTVSPQGIPMARGVLRRRLRVGDAGIARWRDVVTAGYGDHLEENNPGFASRWRRWAGRRGFIDVVASLNPIADNDTETPPHWSVTFGIDDASAAAARRGELGGEVVAGPLERAWTKLVVIKDPQGATFIVSQFVAENKDLDA